MTISPGLRPGFADPVRQSQAAFRACMSAMARPGVIVPVAAEIGPPPPLSPAAAALILSLADFETTLWLDGALTEAPGVTDFIRFHTGARMVTSCGEADFAVISAPEAMAELADFKQGSSEYPDRSTTLVLQVAQLANEGMRFSGPGIDGTIGFSADPLPPDFRSQIAANRMLFPCGVDLFFATQRHIAALPRSALITSES